VTYNFDPERWYDDRRSLLDARLARGDIDESEHRRELVRLAESYERMVERLDGTYRLPR
jgi:uncharacterized membrane protein